MAEYFLTLLGISTQVIAIIIAFYAAYNVYLRQQKDKYREQLIRNFQELNNLIFKWSLLEEYGRPEWSPPIGKYMSIIKKESWVKSLAQEALKEPLSNLTKEFEETRKREVNYRTKFGGLTAGPALYLKVKFALHELISIIYEEFPTPPGDYTLVSDIPVNVKSFVRYDFPNNRKDFLKWLDRFNLFFADINQVYYRIRPILTTLRKIHEESVEQTSKSMKELEKSGAGWTINGMKESSKYLITETNYNEQVFQLISEMKYKIDEIADKICTYDRYCYKGKWKTFTAFLAMVITGIFIPFLALFANIPWLPLEVVEMISGLGFLFSVAIAILLLAYGVR